MNYATLGDLIDRSLRMIGVVPPGQTPEDNYRLEALQAFNSFMSSANADGIQIEPPMLISVPIVSGQQTYTLGYGTTSPDVSLTRPILKLISAYYRDTSNNDYPVDIVGSEIWDGIPYKLNQGSPPCIAYFEQIHDPTQNSTLSFAPIPTTGNTTVYLRVRQAFYQYPNSTTSVFDIPIPPTISEQLTLVFAMRLGIEWQTKLDPVLADAARRANIVLKRISSKPALASFDGSLLRIGSR